MNLINLGWNHFFESQFQVFKEQGFSPARVVRVEREIYLILSEQGEFTAEVSGKFLYNARERSEFPAVGDWVVVSLRPQEAKATINCFLPRKSRFSRKIAMNTTEEQIIAANMDTIFIVTGLDEDFNLRRIERYLTLTWTSNANAVIVLNKMDLCDDVEQRVSEVNSIAFGVPVLPISAETKQGITALHQYLGTGQTAALVGSSGVGKSTITNVLLGEEKQAVGAVREDDSKGRHITSKRELIFVPSGGMIIDNPGMREIQLWADEDDLEKSFKDIRDFATQCKFTDCKHQSEPACAVKKAIEDGTLDIKRFRSYLKQQKQLIYLAKRQNNHERHLWEKNRYK